MIRNRAVWIVGYEVYEINYLLAYSSDYQSLISLSLISIIIMMFVQRMSLKTALGLSPNGKSVLQSTYPAFMKVVFEKEEKCILQPVVCFTKYPCLLHLLWNLTCGVLYHIKE